MAFPCDLLQVLERLPNKFKEFMLEDRATVIEELWQAFAQVYNVVTCMQPTPENLTDCFTLAKSFTEKFVALKDVNEAYHRARVTPYMHSLVYHVPAMMSRHDGIKKFSGQGLEKNNSDSKRYYRSSNKHNGPQIILETKKRIHDAETATASDGQPLTRTKRQYTRK